MIQSSYQIYCCHGRALRRYRHQIHKKRFRFRVPETLVSSHHLLKTLSQRRRSYRQTGTRNPKQGTPTPEPETRNPTPETRHPKPDTWNPTLETRNPEPGTRDQEMRPRRRWGGSTLATSTISSDSSQSRFQTIEESKSTVESFRTVWM